MKPSKKKMKVVKEVEGEKEAMDSEQMTQQLGSPGIPRNRCHIDLLVSMGLNPWAVLRFLQLCVR